MEGRQALGGALRAPGGLSSPVIATLMMVSALSAPQQAPAPLDAFLREELRLDRADLAALDGGGPIVRRLQTTSGRELAFLGIVRVQAGHAEFRRRLGEVDPLFRFAEAVQFGRIEDPSNETFQPLVLPPRDLDALRECRPGRCDLKLPREWIREAGTLDPSDGDYRQKAMDLIRSRLSRYLARYASRGDSALITYHDKPLPVSLAAGHRFLLRQIPPLLARSQVVVGDPSGRRSFSERRFFWSLGETGAQPVAQVIEVVIGGGAGERDPGTVALARQLYATHYYDAWVSVLALFDPVPGDERRGSWLVVLDRSLFDGESGGVRGSFVANRFERAVTQRLRWFKMVLEEG